MSWPSECPACQFGDHANHDRSTVGRAGFVCLGGTYCPCEGDCRDRITPLFAAIAAKPDPEAEERR